MKSMCVCCILSIPIQSSCFLNVLVYCMEIPVNQLLFDRLTCVYTSCKVEENHVSAEELGKGINQDPQIILKNEMVLLKVHYSHICFLSTSKQPEYDIKFLFWLPDFRFWSHCFFTISIYWRIYWWPGGKIHVLVLYRKSWNTASCIALFQEFHVICCYK